MLFVHSYTISFSEVPGEISLCLNISGCPCKCEGCSEPYLKDDVGDCLDSFFLNNLLEKYKNYNLSCICFMGGDKDHEYLLDILKLCVDKGFKTAFYSGFDYLDLDLIPYLNYYKVGRFILPRGDPSSWHKKTGGPINFPWSNQKMFKISNNKVIDITEEFRKNPIGDLSRYIVKTEDK